MIDEERLKTMIKLARNESKRNGQRAIKLKSESRGDYLIRHGILSFLISSLSFVVGLIFYFIFKAEFFINTIFSKELIPYALKIFELYVLVCVVFLCLSLIINNYRFNIYKGYLKEYKEAKELINQIYNKEENK